VGLPEPLWARVIPAYRSAKVALIPTFTGPATINGTVIASIGQASQAPVGNVLANWVIADSKGKANVVMFDVPSFPTLGAIASGFDQVLVHCAACSVTHVNATIPQVDGGQGTGLVVSALRRDSSARYLMVTYAPFSTGLASALTAAGIHGIKIAVASGSVLDQQAILQGTENATTTVGYFYSGWLIADAAARFSEHVVLPSDYGAIPFVLLTGVPQLVGIFGGRDWRHPCSQACRRAGGVEKCRHTIA
ncbi:MAG: hypothetical protein ACYCV7_17570, partial [Acidimicrobiales bacterium]